MATNPQARKWTLDINNPLDHGFDHDKIIAKCKLFCPDYFCLADEIGKQGTLHTHVYIFSESPIRFSTIKMRFPTAHAEKAMGSSIQNREYILKQGKWLDSDKAKTSLPGSFYEFGELPSERQEKNPKMYNLLENVKSGMSTTEIIDDSPSFAFKVKDIDILRETYLVEKHRTKNREITVSYLYGASGTGKTSGIYKTHPAAEICRITDYGGKNGIRFDSYRGQQVLVFEEFSSQIPIEAMLNYLDVYPLTLPARYYDRVAAYTTVYITSNIPLTEQYTWVQQARPETWKAFLRRIHHVFCYRPDGMVEEVNL